MNGAGFQYKESKKKWSGKKMLTGPGKLIVVSC